MAEQKRDYYEVLGISKGATEDEIKKAYRKMAKETHPDLHPGDETAAARFKEVNGISLAASSAAASGEDAEQTPTHPREERACV